jgi:hypothetical protein
MIHKAWVSLIAAKLQFSQEVWRNCICESKGHKVIQESSCSERTRNPSKNDVFNRCIKSHIETNYTIEKTEPTKSNLNLELDSDENVMLDGDNEEELSEEESDQEPQVIDLSDRIIPMLR